MACHQRSWEREPAQMWLARASVSVDRGRGSGGLSTNPCSAAHRQKGQRRRKAGREEAGRAGATDWGLRLGFRPEP